MRSVWRWSPRGSELLSSTPQMEKGLASFEEKAERDLLMMCKEREKLQRTAYELKRRILLCRRTQQLEGILDSQVSCDRGLPAAWCWRGHPARQVEVLTVGVSACLALTLVGFCHFWLLVCDSL